LIAGHYQQSLALTSPRDRYFMRCRRAKRLWSANRPGGLSRKIYQIFTM